MKHAVETLRRFQVPCERRVVSAHRTPELMVEFAQTARARGVRLIIAGAGGAAHLPGMVASLTSLPVLGVPVQSKALSGSAVGPLNPADGATTLPHPCSR